MTANSVLLTVAAFAYLAAPAIAQQLDRRSRDEPEIVVEAGGRVGTCDVLQFTHDGKYLLAAGDDKIVRVWPHSATGLETDRAKVQTLRWRAWREQRGGIKAIAVSSDGKRVAVGGYGMKPSTVAILDRVTGDTLALTWPVVREGDANFNAVTAVAFHPDGRVGFGTADGSLWMWEPTPRKKPDAAGRTAAPPVRVGKHDLPKETVADGGFNFPRLVYFPTKFALVSVAQSGQVYECDLTNPVADTPKQAPPGAQRFDVNKRQPDDDARVYRAELIDDGKWLLIACAESKVLLRSIDGAKTVRLDLRKGQFPRSVAWHPKTRQLAVGVGSVLDTGEKPRFYVEANDEIWLYDDPIAKRDAKPRKLAHTGRAESLAFHPTEPHLAIAGGDADEVTLLNLDNPEKPLTVVRGAGRRPWAVNLSENGKIVGVRVERDTKSVDPNARAAGAWSRFDLSRLKPTLDEGQAWVNPRTDADGWGIVPDAKNSFVWYAERTRDGKKQRLLLTLDRLRDLAPTCFTFLPATDKLPTRVIVGHYYGCTLFELPDRAETGAVAGTKVFTGHAGEVTSVVAAKDQTWFVTGGADHTVAAWSLKEWKSEPNLGAAFAEKDGGVIVTAVDTGSPAWEAGLRAGNLLDLLAVDRTLIFDRREGASVGTVAAALGALKAPRPRLELFIGIAAKEKAKRFDTLTTVRQRPMWKWFPAFDNQNRMNDWVVWMWHGSYYHTKTANGDRLAGWHVNSPEPGGRPEFYQLQQFEKHFHRPEVLENLIDMRDPGAALVAARGENPTLIPFTKYEPAPVRIALKHLDVRPTGLPMTISVRARGSNPDLLPERVELWVNDHLLETWPPAGKALDATKPFEVPYTIPADKFRAGENQVAVLAFNAAGGRAEEFQQVKNARAPGDANLLALLAAVNDYSGMRKNVAGARAFGDLKSAHADATALGKELSKYAGPKLLFKDAKIDLQLDPVRKKFAENLAAIEKRAKPDDTLIVFFAGHGDLLMPKDGPLPNAGRGILAEEGVFLFCCPDYSPTEPGATALSADELFAALAKINCKKVVLLDACHSGRATAAHVIRRCVPNGQGPLVIAACDQGELSYEHPKYGHGLFTFAVLDALDKDKGYRKADFDSDGALSAEELYNYVTAKLPDLLTRAGLKEPQTPVCFPRQLPKAALLKR